MVSFRRRHFIKTIKRTYRNTKRKNNCIFIQVRMVMFQLWALVFYTSNWETRWRSQRRRSRMRRATEYWCSMEKIWEIILQVIRLKTHQHLYVSVLSQHWQVLLVKLSVLRYKFLSYGNLKLVLSFASTMTHDDCFKYAPANAAWNLLKHVVASLVIAWYLFSQVKILTR